MVAVAVVGCGGSTTFMARTGCKGLPTAHQSASFNGAVGQKLLSRQATIAYVCAHLGQPEKITHGVDGVVTWSYGTGNRAAEVSFKQDRVAGGAWFEHGAHNGAYNITESLEVVSNGR